MNKPQYQNGQSQNPIKEPQNAIKQDGAAKQAPMQAEAGPMHEDE